MKHYSPLELDTAYATDPTLAADPEIAEHVADCTRCAAYLRTLEEQSALPLCAPRPPRRILPAVAAALALAAALLLFVKTRGDTTGYVGAKGGSPALQLLVRRAAATKVWDGREPLRPGDALALHVACEGRARVTVAARSAAGWAVLEEAPCPAQPAVLPFTLVVDDAPGPEHVAVVIGDVPLSPTSLGAAIEAPDARTWVTRLTLPKDTGR